MAAKVTYIIAGLVAGAVVLFLLGLLLLMAFPCQLAPLLLGVPCAVI